MPDMLVPLLKLPELAPEIAAARANGVQIRRALPPDLRLITAWVEAHFGAGWASECEICFARQPVTCFVATREKEILGFACYEATHRDFFGPIGVQEAQRGLGIGRALLLACLHGLREMGYAYAIIGGAGPTAFYEKTLGATVIPDSAPGIYVDLLS